MSVPVSTYRLQFRDGMTFARAAGLADYLRALGIDHLYASPLFVAMPGSTHGYDGIDFSEMEPELGGEKGFARLTEALAAAGLGLLLDFVPNHMAASETNRWWHSVLEWGAASSFGAVFDVDWTAPRLLLPILGEPYGDALAAGAFGIEFDREGGRFSFTVYDRRLPLSPPSYTAILGRTEDPALQKIAQKFHRTTVAEAGTLQRQLAAHAGDPETAAAVDRAAAGVSADPGQLHEIHEAQVWRLAHWRLGREALTYRRFFEIGDLVCLSIEDPATFELVHARLLELVAAGQVSGVRLDHIDGLADPAGYLRRLRQPPKGRGPDYLLVEKILEPGERLRGNWPVAGTTGYEFIAALAGLFVDRDREAAMTAAWEEFTGERGGYGAAARQAKRDILDYNLAAELSGLSRRACSIAAADHRTRDLGPDSLRRAILEIAAAMPVYRTYVTGEGPDDADRRLIAEATDEARRSGRIEDTTAVDFVAGLLRLEPGAHADRDAALAFVTRFQQTTGPVMAKAIEDTMFYRYNRLVAVNEVGGAPEVYGEDSGAFHAAMAERREAQPAGLSATATHDTKRGEDARARLYALSEIPETWGEAVARWTAMNAPYRTVLADGLAPEPQMEWLLYQTLAGAWPLSLSLGETATKDGTVLAELRQRMRAYMEKAAREAKTRTSWTAPNAGYERAVGAFAEAALSPETGGAFLQDFEATCSPLWLAGAVNGLSQLALKLFAPGVPDIYQGCELWDFSLVDPDNRAAVNFDERRRLLDVIAGASPEALLADWRSGAPKIALTAAGLRARKRNPALFFEGDYVVLEAGGRCAGNVIAFARTREDDVAITLVPRFPMSMTLERDRPLAVPAFWGDTRIKLPENLRRLVLREAVTGALQEVDDILRVADAFARFPVALFVSERRA